MYVQVKSLNGNSWHPLRMLLATSSMYFWISTQTVSLPNWPLRTNDNGHHSTFKRCEEATRHYSSANARIWDLVWASKPEVRFIRSAMSNHSSPMITTLKQQQASIHNRLELPVSKELVSSLTRNAYSIHWKDDADFNFCQAPRISLVASPFTMSFLQSTLTTTTPGNGS